VAPGSVGGRIAQFAGDIVKIIDPHHVIEAFPDNALELIEAAGRTCYRSEERAGPGTAAKFVAMIMKRGHHSVIEHCSASVRFVCDRGVTHELVRHRLASFSQESTRYCNYSKGKFDGECTFVRPPWVPRDSFKDPRGGERHHAVGWEGKWKWRRAMEAAEED